MPHSTPEDNIAWCLYTYCVRNRDDRKTPEPVTLRLVAAPSGRGWQKLWHWLLADEDLGKRDEPESGTKAARERQGPAVQAPIRARPTDKGELDGGGP